MTSWLHDPFQVKRLEKKLGRKLSTVELEGEQPVRVKEGGRIRFEYIKKYNFKDFYGE